jgi:DNA helicase-2/ATP-dependent DNA helicase PcrA
LKETFDLLIQSAQSDLPPAQILEDVLRLSGYMDMLTERAAASEEDASRVENVNELMNALTAWHEENPAGTLSNFLEEVSLASDIDGWNEKDNAVNFMTMHSAKGLEFNTVFLVGIEDGIIPTQRNLDDESQIEEERRLFYVGSTRAMDSLECSYADQRFRFGSIVPSDPSRFLGDIPKNLYEFSDGTMSFGTMRAAGRYGSPQPAQTTSRTPSYNVRATPSSTRTGTGINTVSAKPAAPVYDEFSQEAEPQYRVGQNVTHKTYGKGRILNISGFGADTKITVLFNDGERRKLMAKFAKLE